MLHLSQKQDRTLLPSILKQQKIYHRVSNFFTRLYWAYSAFTTSLEPQIQLSNGVIIDLKHKRVVIPGDFSLHATGNLTLSSDKHVIINSGKTNEERPGYIHGVWLNPILDSEGKPLLYKHLEAEHGYIKHDEH